MIFQFYCHHFAYHSALLKRHLERKNISIHMIYIKACYTYLVLRLIFILMMWPRKEQKVLDYDFGIVESFLCRRWYCMQGSSESRKLMQKEGLARQFISNFESLMQHYKREKKTKSGKLEITQQSRLFPFLCLLDFYSFLLSLQP